MGFNLLTDQALGEGKHEVPDGLGFETYAKVLAEAAVGTPGPFTIGIFGEWGTGKTSLMKLTQSNLENHPDVLTVWFNAWRFEKEEHPIVPLVGTIVRELETHKTFLSRMQDAGTSLLRSLRAVAYGFSAKSKVMVPGFAEIEASFVAKDMIDREERLTPDPLLDRSLYNQAFEALTSVSLPEGARIVVLIDDLDRCFPDSAIHLLESIKLVLSQRGFVFIMGVARSVLEGYLQHRYEKEYGIADFEGRSYLEKIVQLSFHIPPHAGRMKDFSAATLTRLDSEVGAKLSDILPIAAEALGGNPRSVIRFVNNILIDLAISADLSLQGIMEEIPVEYFAISRCLQERWPQVFSLLTASPKLAAEASEWDRETMRAKASSKDPDVSGLAAALISNRGLLELLTTEHGRSWLAQPDVRDATVRFLRTQRREDQAGPVGDRAYGGIFLSYASDDRGVVSQIAEILTNEGINVFMDTALAPGQDWQKELQRGLTESRAIGVCLSQRASSSKWMQQEIGAALSRRSKEESYLVIPILLPGTNLEHIPESLKIFQALDLSEGITVDRVRSLARVLES